MYRILLIEPSANGRKWIAAALEQTGIFEVVSAVATVAGAKARLRGEAVDAIVLELELAGEGDTRGDEIVLRAVMETWPHVGVCIFTESPERMRVLRRAGLVPPATILVTKPNPLREESVSECIARELSPKLFEVLNAIRPAPVSTRGKSPPIRPLTSGGVMLAPRRIGPLSAVKVLAIGSSTGGPEALATILRALPADFSIPVLVSQHMPANMTGWLATSLAAHSKLPVREAADGETLRAGEVIIAPGDQHLTLRKTGLNTYVSLSNGPPEHSCRPAVDPMLRSVARTFGSGTLAVILTGMGIDGFEGCTHVFAAGGQLLAQDEETSVVWGMPGVVARAGIADDVLPLNLIAHEILARVSGRRGAANKNYRRAAGSRE
jgi:two-component system chemotaxis response regulator CheB